MNVSRVAPILMVLLCMAMLLAACSKRQSSPASRSAPRSGQPESSANAAKVGGARAGTGGGSSPAGTIRLTPVQPSGGTARASNPEPTAPSKSVASPLSGTERLMAMRGGSKVFPADFAIGPLQPLMPVGTEQGRILRVIRVFFGALAQGKIDASAVSPQWKDELIRMLSYPRSQGDLPTSVRIGGLRIEEGKAHAAVRMEKGTGRATGEVYLERVDGKWYISDIQADFAQLAKPYVRRQPFDPAEWKSLMKE